MKMLSDKKSLLFGAAVCAGLFCHNTSAQYESEPLSVALDNTKLRCFSHYLVPTYDTSTKGGSSVSYAPPEDRGRGSNSQLQCYMDSSKAYRVTFDWKLTKFRTGDRLQFSVKTNSHAETLLDEQVINTDWITKSFLVPQGSAYLLWDFWDQGGAAWVDNLRVSQVNPLSLALDNLTLNFETAGLNTSSVDTHRKTTGDSSVRSGSTNDDEQTFLFTTVNGGQRLKFDWQVSSELFFDGMVFFVLDSTGELAGDPISISGESDWIAESYDIPGSGMHTLVWTYVKNAQNESGFDAAWLDHVRLTGLPTKIGWLPAVQDLILAPDL